MKVKEILLGIALIMVLATYAHVRVFPLQPVVVDVVCVDTECEAFFSNKTSVLIDIR